MAAKGQLTNLPDEVLHMLFQEHCDDVGLLMLSWTCRKFRCLIAPDVANGLLGSGRKSVHGRDKWLPNSRSYDLAYKIIVYPWWVRDAVRHGYISILKLAVMSGNKKWWPTMGASFWNACHDLVNYQPCDALLEFAARSGNLESLKAVELLTGAEFTLSVYEAAAESGSVECLRWLDDEVKCPRNDVSACKGASASGVVEAMAYILASEGPWNPHSTWYAGSVACLNYGREHGGVWNESVTSHAAGNGHLEVLQAAREAGLGWNDTLTCENAAAGGHLECLKWAHENGAPWDEDTVITAVENGHLECLQYAVENGCPYDLEACIECVTDEWDKLCQYDSSVGRYGWRGVTRCKLYLEDLQYNAN